MELRLPVAASGFVSKISKSNESLSKFAGALCCQLDRYHLIAKKDLHRPSIQLEKTPLKSINLQVAFFPGQWF